jgi:hypothetical protein
VKRILHIVLVLVAVAACQGPRIIPKGTLTDIYVDMFLADQQVREQNIPRTQMDSLLVYEAVFNKYGYNTDDYLNSVRHYLKDPERFAKVFEEVNKRLEGELKALDRQIEYEQNLANKRATKYPLVDSLLAPFSQDAVFVGLARVERDSSRYPAWFRLMPVREDTLMVSVDSLKARAARKDSLAAREKRSAEVAKKPDALILKQDIRQRPLRERPAEPEKVEETIVVEEIVLE